MIVNYICKPIQRDFRAVYPTQTQLLQADDPKLALEIIMFGRLSPRLQLFVYIFSSMRIIN